MIELLDYILDEDDNFWIVNNITNHTLKGYMVYRVSAEGRYNKITNKTYKKVDDNGIIEIPMSYKKIFNPRKFYVTNRADLKGIWKDYADVLNEIGIPGDNIGIFGSYLIGFEICKDVDFVIYGKDNLHKYYENIKYIRQKLNATSISNEHIEYQFNKHKIKFGKDCDLKEIISRNWSGIQLDNGVLSTPRFIEQNDTSIIFKNGTDKLVEGKVLEGFYSAMLPRKAIVEVNDEIYEVASTLWKFQSFAHKNDIIQLYANVDEENKRIILDDNRYYIKYIHKSNTIL